MSDITLSGNDTIRGQHKQPYSGAWVAECKLDAQQAPSGQVTLTILGRDWHGSVIFDPAAPAQALSGEDAGFWVARIVGGTGGLGKPVQPNEWGQGAVVSQVLAYILQAAGETQAADIDVQLLSRTLPQWSVTLGSSGAALAQLVDYLGGGSVWRIRDDGKVWLGVPALAAVTPPDYRVLEPGPDAGQATWDLNDSSLAPDQIVDGLTLRQVIYAWDQDKLQALVTFAPGPVNALYGLFLQWQRRIGLDHFRSTGGRIDSQNDGATAQFQPDSSAFSPLRRMALYYGLPDTDCQGLTGRAVAAWDGALPTSPGLRGFGPGPNSKATKIKIGGSAPLGTKALVNKSQRDAEQTLNGDIESAFAAIGAQPPPTSLPTALSLLVFIQQALGAAGLVTSYQTYEAHATDFLTTILEGG